MKQLFLLLLSTMTVSAMQNPQDTLLNAIDVGDVAWVENLLVEHFDILAPTLKRYNNYVNRPVAFAREQLNKGDRKRAQEYVQIARIMVDNGAPADANKIKELRELEAQINQRPAAPAAPRSIPSPSLVPVAQPKPAPIKPISKAPSIAAPIASGDNERLANELLARIDKDTYGSFLIESMKKIDITKLSQEKQTKIIRAILGGFRHSGNYESASQYRKLVLNLIAQGAYVDARAKEMMDQLFKRPGASGQGGRSQWSTPLVEAIRENNIHQINKLITEDKSIIDHPDSFGKSPLGHAVHNKQILEILLRNGADASVIDPYERATASKTLGRPL